MKKLLFIAVISIMFIKPIYGATEIQLTDYLFIDGKRLMDGYNYVSQSASYNCEQLPTEYYDEIENNILTPNGTQLYNSLDFTVSYIVSTEGDELLPEKYYSYPQGISGKHFIITQNNQPYFSCNNHFYNAIMNNKRLLVTTPQSIIYNCVSPKYYYFNKYNSVVDSKGIINIQTGIQFALGGSYYYYNSDTQEFAVVFVSNNTGQTTLNSKFYITVKFYKNDLQCGSYNANKPYSAEYNDGVLSYNNSMLKYKNKSYYMVTGYKPHDSYVFMNYDTKESESDRVDKSYTFKKKQINNQTYYALFKELKDGEIAADFIPTEQPTPKYAEYIDQMYNKDLLFNNEMCFYKRGITRLDFGIVLGRMYCNAIGYNIDELTTNTKFTDVNNPYCLYLSDNSILTSSDALGFNLYLNEKEITKKDVSNALDNVAKKCDVFSKWNNIKVIQPTDAVCSRELAYVETFRLYDLIKQQNDANYVKFQSSQVLDSDSEAETMHYETVNYNEKSKGYETDTTEPSTTETTVVAQSERNNNPSIIEIAIISIGSMLILLIGACFNNTLTQRNH